MVGINRNDVYITLERGEYDKGTKTAQKNVEVAVVVVNDSGEIRQVSFVCISTIDCFFVTYLNIY